MAKRTTREPEDLRRRLVQAMAGARPRSPEALWQFVRTVYGLAVPRRAVCPGHAAPMEYLVRAVLEPGRDLVVWASRGGAKTELGSLATHLDAILRPGCQTRILGGSLDQSEKMYEYLLRKWDGAFAGYLAREPTARRTELVNGSIIEVLTQSPRSVRGQRVHRLKCDEVDEFGPEVWRAAQFVTQSAPGLRPSGGKRGRKAPRGAWRGEPCAWIPAQLEVFSTMHRPFGPMARLVDHLTQNESCAPEGTPSGRDVPSRKPQLLKWCLWEVLEPCPPERSCSRCPLWSDCEGRARGADGYFPIDDAIAQHARASREAWEAEMLCLRPRGEGLVFAEFNPASHVAPVGFDASLPLYRAIDFGYANPFVCLWVQVKSDCGSRTADGACSWAPLPGGPRGSAGGERQSPDLDLSHVQARVLAEYVERERPIAEHAHAMASRDPGPVLATYGDPAGWQRSDITGTGPCQELAALGIRVRTPRAGILEGVEMLRRLVKPRPGREPGLVIDPSCRWLVQALQEYHWEGAADGRRSERPAKDGPDHPIDALRYLLTGLFLKRDKVRERRW